MPEEVIRRFAATLSDPQASPTLSEGFEALHPLDPSRGVLQEQIRQALEGTALNQGTDDGTTEA